MAVLRRSGVLGVVATAALAWGCASLAGNGDIVEERRNVPPFVRVEVSNGFRGEVAQVAPGAPEGTWLRGDSNLLPRVALVVDDGTLSMRLPDDVALLPTKPFVLVVEAVAPEGVKADEGATVVAEDIAVDRFEAEARSGARAVVRGPGGAVLEVVSHSGSKVEAGDYLAGTVKARVTEGSSAVVRASEALEALVSQGSSLTCRGEPARRDVESREGSSVKYE